MPQPVYTPKVLSGQTKREITRKNKCVGQSGGVQSHPSAVQEIRVDATARVYDYALSIVSSSRCSLFIKRVISFAFEELI